MPRVSNRGLSQRVRTSPRAFLRLEMLETRCLLSGWPPKVGPDIDRPPAVERPASDVARTPNDGLKVRDAQPTESGKLSPAHPPSASQDLDTNYVGDSTGSPDVTPGLAGLPQANYVIVPEISTPHHTIASAQVLPDLPYFGVVGTLGAGDEIDLYQLALDSNSERLDFGLVMQGQGGSVPATFQILDGSGQVLGTWNLGSVGNSTIQVDIEKLSPGTSLYLGVSAGNSSTTVELSWSFRDRRLSALGGSPAGAPPDVLIDRQLDSARPGLNRAFSAADSPGRPGTVILARRFRGSPDRTGDRIRYRECDRRLAGNPLGWGFPGVVVKRRTRSVRRAGTRHLGSSRGCRGVPCQARVGT